MLMPEIPPSGLPAYSPPAVGPQTHAGDAGYEYAGADGPARSTAHAPSAPPAPVGMHFGNGNEGATKPVEVGTPQSSFRTEPSLSARPSPFGLMAGGATRLLDDVEAEHKKSQKQKNTGKGALSFLSHFEIGS